MLDSIAEKFSEYSDILYQANDLFASIPDKLRGLFEGGSGVLGRFIKWKKSVYAVELCILMLWVIFVINVEDSFLLILQIDTID